MRMLHTLAARKTADQCPDRSSSMGELYSAYLDHKTNQSCLKRVGVCFSAKCVKEF